MSKPDDILFRAVEFLRSAPESGWDDVAGRVVAAVRSTPGPVSWPLAAEKPAGWSGPGALYLSDAVVRGTLAAALRHRYLCAPTAIGFDVDDGILRGVHIEVTGSYGTELRELAAAIRVTTVEIVTDLLGASANVRPVDVTVTDVVAGDPMGI